MRLLTIMFGLFLFLFLVVVLIGPIIFLLLPYDPNQVGPF